MEGIITYETLYEILRKEKYSTELQKLDQDFFQKVITYLTEKKAILDSQTKKSGIFSSSEAQRTKRQLENVVRIIRELYDRRESKIIQLATFYARTKFEIDHSIFLQEEKELFGVLCMEFSKFRGGILNNILNGELPKLQKIEKKTEPKELKSEDFPNTKLIRFKEAVPKFIGSDLKTYGPFIEEDLANLPSDVAELLIKKERAEIISNN